MNLYPITVIENFYKNPKSIRQFALKQKFTACHERKNIDYVYPGARTKDLFELDASLYRQVCEKLVSIFHNTEHDVMRWAISTSFQSVTKEYGEGVIHTDKNTIFAAVLYLSPNAPNDTGTSLFKRNSSFSEAKYEKALADNDQRFMAGDIKMDTSYHSMFDEVVRVNNVYNTLILYEGEYFHSANKFFGKTLKDSRLAQVFFISKIDAQKHSVFPIKRLESFKI